MIVALRDFGVLALKKEKKTRASSDYFRCTGDNNEIKKTSIFSPLLSPHNVYFFSTIIKKKTVHNLLRAYLENRKHKIVLCMNLFYALLTVSQAK